MTTSYDLLVGASMAADVASNRIEITGISAVAIVAVYTGSPVGTIKLQASVREDNTDWNDVADSSFSISSAGIYTWNYDPVAVPYLRVVYTRTSGTGALSAAVFKKGL